MVMPSKEKGLVPGIRESQCDSKTSNLDEALLQSDLISTGTMDDTALITNKYHGNEGQEDIAEDEGEEIQRLAELANIDIGRKTKRPMCSMCNRPRSACWCCGNQQLLRHVRSKVLVLQHPHEEKRCLRTAPMLENALPNCRIVKGKKFNKMSLPELDANNSSNTVVLFPAPDAVDVTSLPPVAVCGAYTLVVLDGTWHQARAIMHNTRQLHNLRKVVVHSDAVSEYVIRTQPSETALSTVESTALALAALEDDPSIFTILVAPLAALCKHQLSHGAVIHHSKERRYKEAHGTMMGKRTAKTLAECGAKLNNASSITVNDNISNTTINGNSTDNAYDNNNMGGRENRGNSFYCVQATDDDSSSKSSGRRFLTDCAVSKPSFPSEDAISEQSVKNKSLFLSTETKGCDALRSDASDATPSLQEQSRQMRRAKKLQEAGSSLSQTNPYNVENLTARANR
uniref:tRNA-uridine aminocarboxypropyltransferase n=1 Tax=Hirondellea gigas TaxID=1518452 RepID=A0A2P2I7G7_9CRUS